MFIQLNKTQDEIQKDILSQVSETYQKSPGFFVWDYTKAFSYELKNIWDKLAYICGFGDINNFEYDDLVKFVFQRRGIIAKTETCANGNLTVLNGQGFIQEGTLFETDSGLQFKAILSQNVTTNSSFEVICLSAGPQGNVPIGSVKKIPVTIPGVVEVSNLEPFSGGYEKESKSSIIERYLNDLQKPITSANIYHYEKWAKECTGVGNAKIKPLWNGDNTVKIIITDSNNEPANSELVNFVQNYIDPEQSGTGSGQAPIGAYCTVSSASPLAINVSCSIKFMSGVVFEDAVQNIKTNLKNYLHSTVFKSDYISYAKILSCILNSDGVKDLSNLLLNGGDDNILISDSVSASEIAVLGEVTIEEV